MPQFSHLYSSALDYELGTDDATRLFTTARRRGAINEGVEQFADLTECYVRQSTIASSNGVAEYNLLSTVNVAGGDYVRLAKQRPEYRLASSGGSSGSTTFTSGEDFTFRSVEWLNQYEPGWEESTGGTPRYYYERVDGGRRFFGMSPPPQITSSRTGRVILPYVAKPQTLVDDTHVPFFISSTAAGPSTGVRTDLEVYHQAFVHYAAHKLEKLRGNTEGSQAQLQIFLGWVQRYLGDQRPKGGTTIKHARSYFAETRRNRNAAELPKPPTGWNYGG